MKKHPVTSDPRYTVTQEFTGHESGKPRFVVRFCGDYVSSHATYPAAVLRAIGDSNVRRGAIVFVESAR